MLDPVAYLGCVFVWLFGGLVGDSFRRRNVAHIKILIRLLKNKIRGYIVPAWQPL
jgi:hypothetical protein